MAEWTPEEVYLITERAYALFVEGRPREAAILFEGVAAIDPKHTYSRKALATVYLSQGEPHRALEYAEAALRADPGDLEARLRRCEALIECGMLSTARPDFEMLRTALPRGETRRLEARLGVLEQRSPARGGQPSP